MQQQHQRALVEEEAAATATNARHEVREGGEQARIKQRVSHVAPTAKSRSDLVIIGDILRVASRNGGESITALKQGANLSQRTMNKYLKFMLGLKLLSSDQLRDGNVTTVYRPTEIGYDFLLKQRELLALLDLEDTELFVFRDW